MKATTFQIGRSIRHAGRLAHITNVFARNGLWSFFDAMGIRSQLTPQQIKEAEDLSSTEGADPIEGGPQSAADIVRSDTAPVRLRKALEELGPAFVKLGQMMATREDLLPKSFTEELSKLHQNVQPVSFETIQSILKSELSEARCSIIKSIDPTPLAAGSIGQVHCAELQSGRKVVIKFQRPQIAQQVEIDLSLMSVLASLLEKYIPDSRSLRPKLTVEEFSRATLAELDYVREAGNMTKVAANFAGMSYARVPDVIWELSTSKILTQEFLDGESLAERDKLLQRGFDPALLIERGLNIFMQMVFKDGMFHGDLHPGNLMALEGNRIGIIDLGLVVSLGRNARERLAGLLNALVHEDYESMVSYYLELADPGPGFQAEAFQHDLANALSPFVGLKIAEMRSGKLLWDFARIAAAHGAPMPRELIMFLRTLVGFEGVSARLDPSFDIFSSCQRFADELVRGMYSPENIQRQGILIARDLIGLGRFAPRQIRNILKSLSDGQTVFKIESEAVSEVASALDRSVSRLAVSVIIGSLLIASALMLYIKAESTGSIHFPTLGLTGLVIAATLSLYVIGSIFRSR